MEQWAYIVHDSDIDDNDKSVEPHIHLVIVLDESLNISTIANIVGVQQQYVAAIRQKIKAGRGYRADIGGALLYLTHRNAPEKHQYSDDQVIAKPGFDWKAIRAKSEKAQEANKSYQKAIEGILSGKIRQYNIEEHISIDNYVANRQDYERAFEYREKILKSQQNRKVENHADRAVIDAAYAACWRRYLFLCAKVRQYPTPELVKAISKEQFLMQGLISYLPNCRNMKMTEKLSAARWSMMSAQSLCPIK